MNIYKALLLYAIEQQKLLEEKRAEEARKAKLSYRTKEWFKRVFTKIKNFFITLFNFVLFVAIMVVCFILLWFVLDFLFGSCPRHINVDHIHYDRF